MNVITVNKVPVAMNLEQQVIYEMVLAELNSMMLPKDFNRSVSTRQEIMDYEDKRGSIQDHTLLLSKRIINTIANRKKENNG